MPYFQDDSNAARQNWESGQSGPAYEQYQDNYPAPYDEPAYDDPSLPEADWQEAFLHSKEEKQLRRNERIRVAAGMMDFIGVIAGAVVCLLLIALLVSLINFLESDFQQTMALMLHAF